jgi:hypothetical protein
MDTAETKWPAATRKVNRAFLITTITGLTTVAGVTSLVTRATPAIFAIAFLLILCSLVLGLFLGFLFGLPIQNTLLQKGTRTSEKPLYTDDDGKAVPLLPYTNLTQISDWLTKIFVGIGLIELPTLPNRFSSLAKYFAPFLGNNAYSPSIVLAILGCFPLLGFLFGYWRTKLQFILMLEEKGTPVPPKPRSAMVKSDDPTAPIGYANNKNNINMADLTSFVGQHIGSENQFGSYYGTRTWDNLYEIVQSEQHTEPLLATLAWQIILQDPRIIDSALQRDFSIQRTRYEYIVSTNGQGQYALVVLAPFPSEFTIVSPMNRLPERWLSDAYYNWRREMTRYVETEESGLFNRAVLRAVEPEFVQQVVSNLNMQMIITKKPRLIRQQMNFPCIPSPAHGVCPQGFELPNSTAGVYAENARGQKGAVICLHALGDVDSAMAEIESGNNKVVVNNYPGKIVTYDPISDSCFVVFDDQDLVDNGTFQKITGLLTGKTPRQYESAFFDGFRSGPLSTNINGWSPDLPFVKRHNQLKVYTNAITNPGDSGCALKDSEGNVCGFAFERSGISENPQLSSWIWAESVFKFHKLNY